MGIGSTLLGGLKKVGSGLLSGAGSEAASKALGSGSQAMASNRGTMAELMLDRNADLRNTGAADNGIKKGLWLYASIPLAVQYEMLTKHGINIHNKDHWPRMFELINTDYPYLKTTNKTHALKGQGKIYAAPKNSPKKASWTPPGQSSITH